MANCHRSYPLSPLDRKHSHSSDDYILGFTLAETIITLLVIGILFAIAAPSYLSWANSKRVDDALAQVVGAFKEAQSEALRRGENCTVTISPSTRRISAQRDSGGNCLPTGNRDFSNSNFNLQINTDFDSSNELVFTFKKTTPNKGMVVLSLEDAPRRRCVVVSSGIGIIRTGYYQGNPAITLLEGNCNRDP